MFNETYEYIERSKSGNIELLHQNLRLASSNKDQNFNDFKEMIFNDMRQSLGYDREQEITKCIPPNRTDAMNLLQWLNKHTKKINRTNFSSKKLGMK